MTFGHRVWIALLLVAVVATTLPAVRAQAAPAVDQEVALGRRGAQEIERRYKVVTDAAVADRVRRIGAAVAAQSQRPQLPYSFKVVEVTDVNAVALPGGFVYLTTGLMNFVRSDHELAAVIAHEVAHAALGHGIEMQRRANRAMFVTLMIAIFTRDPSLVQGSSLISTGLMAGYTRDLEREADLASIDYLLRTSYSAVGVLTLLERLYRAEQLSGQRDAGAFADHPKTSERVQYVGEALRVRHVALNRRAPANFLVLKIREGVEGGAAFGEILVNDRSILKLNDVARIKEAADLLDRLFDADLDPFEVSARETQDGWGVFARGWPIVRLGLRDVPAGAGTVREFAITVSARLKAAIDDDIRRRRITG